MCFLDKKGRFCRGGRRGFTLIELLLVLFIMAITIAVVIPSLGRSFAATRLRTASRTVATMGRYARSMAVLKQREMSVIFDLDRDTISVEPGMWYLVTNEDEKQNEPGDTEGEALKPGESEKSHGVDLADIRMTRHLKNVGIKSVTFEDGDRQVKSGSCAAIYGRNGRCDDYVVKLMDKEGETTVITVDPIAVAEIERGEREETTGDK